MAVRMLVGVLFLALITSGCGRKDDAPVETEKTDTETAEEITYPDTEIYVLTIGFEDNDVSLGSVVNITERDGYDNQPQFTPDEMAVVYSSVRDGKQADIYRFEFLGRKTVQVTDTLESEFSPTPLSEGGYSTVRVEEDGSQRLWRMGESGVGLTPVLDDITGIGYHAWIDEDHLALFIVGDEEKGIPHTLQLTRISTGESEKIIDNPGRTLMAIPGETALSFVDKTVQGEWKIKRFDLPTRQMSDIVSVVGANEDFVWTPNGGLLMADGKAIYHWPGRGEWQKALDLERVLVGPISRIAINPEGTRLALVASKEPE